MTTVNGINTGNSIKGTNSTSNNVLVVEDTNLFDTEETTSTTSAAQTEAEIAAMEAEIQRLNTQKVQLEAEKKELDAQKKSLSARKSKLDAEIAANDETIRQYQDQVKKYEKERAQEKAELAEFQRKYSEENKKSNELNKKLNERIKQLLEQSALSVKNYKETIEETKAEADEKVKSGELKEDEVAQYIAQKLGVATNNNNAALLSEINTLNQQTKIACANSARYLNEIGIRETNINELNAKIASGSKAIAEITAENVEKNSDLAGVTKELNCVNTEISSLDSQIGGIDNQVSSLNSEISVLKSTSSSTDGVTGIVIPSGNNNGVFVEKDGKNNKPNGGSHNFVPSTKQRQNPFVAISFEKVDYSTMVDALDVLSMSNDIAVNAARQQVEKDNETKRNLFQQYTK